MKNLKLLTTFVLAMGLLTVSANADTIRFWTTEHQPERLAKQEAMAADFNKKTGHTVEVIPVEEKDLGTRTTAAFAAGDLPDVIYHTLQYVLPPIKVIPLKQAQLKRDEMYWREKDQLASTEFTFTRFLLPELADFKGWALFIDCDFIALDDVKKLFDQADNKYAIMCAQHDYTPKAGTKMDGQQQHNYPRKNWSSMMLVNCGVQMACWQNLMVIIQICKPSA